MKKSIYFILFISLLISIIGCNNNFENNPIKKDGTIIFSGKYNNEIVNHKFLNCYALFQIDDVEIQFNGKESDNKLLSNLKGIELCDIHKRNLLKQGELKIVTNPENDDEIAIELDFINACDLNFSSGGKLKINEFKDKQIKGEIELIFAANEKMKCEFDLPLIDNIPAIPLPIKTKENEVLEYKLISDGYPDDGLKFNQIVLNGNIGGISLNDVISEGRVSLNKKRLEIKIYSKTDFKDIEIDFKSINIDKKLYIGSYKVLPFPESMMEKINLELKSKNELGILYADWEDSINDECPFEGTLNISAYAENGISGSFDGNVCLKENVKSNIIGKFKLPLILK